jgi:phosphoribosyl 1,2-cyclic phosphodiesterase
MTILVLGSGAGGGFPQRNCNCGLCGGQRRGTMHALRVRGPDERPADPADAAALLRRALAPAAGRLAMAGASCVMVDGTFWTDDEMVVAGLVAKTAAELGHLPQSGPAGMVAALAPLPARRKVLIHVNNSNPILDEDSVQRRELQRHGIEVAHDGMEIEL